MGDEADHYPWLSTGIWFMTLMGLGVAVAAPTLAIIDWTRGDRLGSVLVLIGGAFFVVVAFVAVQVLRILLDIDARLRRLVPDEPKPVRRDTDDAWVD